MKMFLTRFGMRSRMVVCGDPKQVDLPEPASPGCTTRSPGSRASTRSR